MSILDIFGWKKNDDPYRDMENSMTEACNAVKKQGMKGYIKVEKDLSTGFQEVSYHKKKGGKTIAVRMPAVDNLVNMEPENNARKVAHFLAKNTHVAVGGLGSDWPE